jgi:hypothetical protein
MKSAPTADPASFGMCQDCFVIAGQLKKPRLVARQERTNLKPAKRKRDHPAPSRWPHPACRLQYQINCQNPNSSYPVLTIHLQNWNTSDREFQPFRQSFTLLNSLSQSFTKKEFNPLLHATNQTCTQSSRILYLLGGPARNYFPPLPV